MTDARERTAGPYAWLPAVIGFLALAGVAVGWVGLGTLRDRLIASTGRTLALTAAESIDKLDLILTEHASRLRILAHDPVLALDDELRVTARLRAFVRDHHHEYRWVGVADLSGHVMARVESRGKHILMRVDSGQTIHSHLKMDGEWRLARTGSRPRGRWHEVSAVLTTEPWTAFGSLLGILEIWPTEREHDRLGHLGPDVLGPDWDAAEATRRLTADPSRSVGEAVIDQRVMAGPGNVYRSEVCFLRGVDPRTPVGQVRDPAALVKLMQRLVFANRDRSARVTTGNTREGQRVWVYGRTGEPCRRCGTPIERIVQGAEPEERVAYLCPSCQPPADG
jgi:endonuclease-8